jgi:glycosyltransferase involved in cell wall biosynthesis
MGSLSPDDLAKVLRASDAFVLPSYNEGMANALLEAMASGLACITTEVGGHNEVIVHNEDGLLVQPKTTDELRNAIKAVVSDEPLRRKLGVNARKRMIAFGNYEHNSAKLKQLLADYAGKPIR